MENENAFNHYDYGVNMDEMLMAKKLMLNEWKMQDVVPTTQQ